MVRLKCIKQVRDRYTGERYEVGTSYDFEDDRAAEVLESEYFSSKLEDVEIIENDQLKEKLDETESADEATETAEPTGSDQEHVEDLTNDQLKEKLEELGIEYKAKATKKELIDLLT